MLNFSQPTVTAHIQALEEELGQKLIIHKGKKNVLTREGVLLKEKVDEMLQIEDEITVEFSALSKSNKVIHLAAHESFCSVNFPSIIISFLKKYPGYDIELSACDTNQIIEGISSNKFDIGVISGTTNISGMYCNCFDHTPVELFVAPQLATHYSMTEIVEKFPYFHYRADALSYGLDIDRLTKACGIRSGHIMNIESITAITEMVRAGIGYTVFTKDNVIRQIAEGSIVSITPPDIHVYSDTSVICLEEEKKQPEIQCFLDTIYQNWNGGGNV